MMGKMMRKMRITRIRLPQLPPSFEAMLMPTMMMISMPRAIAA